MNAAKGQAGVVSSRRPKHPLWILFFPLLLTGQAPALKEQPPIPGWLGVSIQEVTEDLADDLAQRFGPAAGNGVFLAEILKGGPAERAGLRRGDVVVELDDQPVWDVRQLQKLIRRSPPGKRSTLTLLRERQRIRLTVEISAMPEERQAEIAGEPYGIYIREVTPGEREPSRTPPARRLAVVFVDPNSAAERAGLRARDLLLEIEGRRLSGLEDYLQAMRQVRKGEGFAVVVERDGAPLTLRIRWPGADQRSGLSGSPTP